MILKGPVSVRNARVRCMKNVILAHHDLPVASLSLPPLLALAFRKGTISLTQPLTLSHSSSDHFECNSRNYKSGMNET